MTDIDFDEIDRAVASATGQQGASVLPPVEVSVGDRPEAATGAAPVIAQRSRGRVMDIVHPVATRQPVPSPKLQSAATELQDLHNSDSKESPFIVGAKIDKRPLGEFSPSEIAKEDTDSTNQPVDSGKVEASDFTNEMLEAPLPAELHPDVIELELGDVAGVTEELLAPEPLSVLAKVDTKKEVDTVSIYDTDTYHKPLAHPQKKPSGILTTVWIILLIVLGVGGGFAFYYFVWPLLT